MDNEARRLVDDEEVLVLVRDAKRRCLLDRGPDDNLPLGHREGDLLAFLYAVALRAAFPVDRDRSAFVEEPLCVRARAELLERREEAVQPRAGGVSGDADAGDRRSTRRRAGARHRRR